jgi:ketosteroid isomerase-like protein
MRKMLLLSLNLSLGLLLLAGGGESSNSESEQEKVLRVVKQYVKALKAEDVETLSQLFVQDEDLVTISAHIPRIGLGPEILEATAKGWFDAVEDIDVTVRNEIVKVGQAGKAAWVSFTLDGNHSIPNLQEPFEFEGMRVTWGLEKREGDYIIVQGHWSFASENPRE